MTEEAQTDKQTIYIDYTNWRGERRIQPIVPVKMVFGTTEHHPKAQWLLEAVDQEKGESRYFALTNVHSWSNRK